VSYDIHPKIAIHWVVFRIAAWSSNPSCIPHDIDLVIPELEVAVELDG
jgi:hypothetical protein